MLDSTEKDSIKAASMCFVGVMCALLLTACAAPQQPQMVRTTCPECRPCPPQSGHDGPKVGPIRDNTPACECPEHSACPECICPPPSGAVRLTVFNPYRATVSIELKCHRYRRCYKVLPKGSATLRIPRRSRRCEAWPKVRLW